jgi:hypothetical protein
MENMGRLVERIAASENPTEILEEYYTNLSPGEAVMLEIRYQMRQILIKLGRGEYAENKGHCSPL